jgi:anti-sigma factor RsiW
MPDDLEFSISQYLDGTLADEERVALERRLAEDAGARALLEEYRGLDAALRAAPPVPEIRWELLAESISAAVTESAEERAEKSYRLPAWVRLAAPLALAASLLIAAGVAFRMYSARPGRVATTNRVLPTPPPVAFVNVEGPRLEKADGPADVQIAIGPGKAIANDSALAQYSDDVVSRPSHITVASGALPAQDSPLPFFDMQ